MTGILVAWVLLDRRYRAKGGPTDVTVDVTFWMVIVGIIGARLYHVVTTPDPYFGPNGDLSRIVRVWEGGLGIWGAIAAGGLGAWILMRTKGLRTDALADAVAPGLLLAQAIGRLGNYFNQELYGRPTDLPWGLEIAEDNIVGGYPAGTLFHPTFLYELLWCAAGAALLLWLEKRFSLRRGQTFWAYVMIYTAGRVWIENLRIDDAQIVAGLRLNVWTSIIIFTIATALFVWRTRVAREEVDSEIYLPGHEPAGNNIEESEHTHGGENDTSTAETGTAGEPDSAGAGKLDGEPGEDSQQVATE